MDRPIPVILDTDIGTDIDDALAIFEDAAKAVGQVVENQVKILKKPETILKKPSSVLDPYKPIKEVMGLQKPIDELNEEVEKNVGKGLKWTGKQFKQTLKPAAQDLVSECTAALVELYSADLSPPISPVMEPILTTAP